MGNWWSTMVSLGYYFKCHVIGVEYPGYGICFRETKDAQTIKIRAKRTYDFLTQEFGFEEKDIIVFGRSIGSGPAIDLAAQTHPCALVLMSAYTSLKNVAYDKVKWISCLLQQNIYWTIFYYIKFIIVVFSGSIFQYKFFRKEICYYLFE